jgi:hypothetical protein
VSFSGPEGWGYGSDVIDTSPQGTGDRELARQSRRLPPTVRASPSPESPPRPIEPPAALRIQRNLPPGRYPLLTAFRGLDRTAGFRTLPVPAVRRDRTARAAHVVIVPEDAWMYVAPRFTPEQIRRFGYEMVASSEDVIVVGHNHIAKSPALVVYLDIIHEFLHLIQRADGRELWDPKVDYVDRSTEIEAYRHSVGEARRLGASDEFLRDYLQVEWVALPSIDRLLRHLRVGPRPAAARPDAKRRS